MTVLSNWDDFEKAAERLYLQEPSKARYSLKYHHSKELLEMKMTDNVVCLQYRTDAQQDVKKMEKFVNNLMPTWHQRRQTKTRTTTTKKESVARDNCVCVLKRH